MNTTLVITVETKTCTNYIGLTFSKRLMAASCVEFTDPHDKRQEKGLSEDLISLKNSLFQIPGVKQIFFSPDSISLIRADDVERSRIIPAAKRRIRRYPF